MKPCAFIKLNAPLTAEYPLDKESAKYSFLIQPHTVLDEKT